MNRKPEFHFDRSLYHSTADVQIRFNDIDILGHLNNVVYIRHAEALAPRGCTLLEVVFDRECFAGETLTLETAQADGFFVRGRKENGEESFRTRFWKENME